MVISLHFGGCEEIATEADREHERAPQRVLEIHRPERARHRIAERKQQPCRHCADHGELGADDDVPEAEKTRRIMALQALQGEIQTALFAQAVGTVQDVLVDSVSRRRSWELAGRTTGNLIVNFPGTDGWMGRLIPVRITAGAPNSLRGEPVDAAAGGTKG